MGSLTLECSPDPLPLPPSSTFLSPTHLSLPPPDRLYGDDEAGSFSSGHDMPDQLLMKASLSQSDSDIDTYSFGFLNLKNLDVSRAYSRMRVSVSRNVLLVCRI